MKHIDLFSGIGGFALAVDRVFYEQENQHIFIENDPFCQAVLRKHWPEAKIHGDIRAFTNIPSERRMERESNDNRSAETETGDRFAEANATILTGGFPCQPFSQAGVRKGEADDRYLWPEMLRVIREFRPQWVIAENVNGLLSIQDGMVFEQVCADLENEGYEVQPYVIPACAVGAPHRRDRVWIVGFNTHSERERAGHGEIQKADGEVSERNNNAELGDASERNASHSECAGLEGYPRNEYKGGETRKCSNKVQHNGEWKRSWQEVAFATCYDGMDDGLPRRMDGTTISAAKHRKERLKACGNAIVPQVAEEILEGIKHNPSPPNT